VTLKILLTGLPIYSHLIPVMVPLAGALKQSGHTVAVATGASMERELERRGVSCLRVPGVGSHAEMLDDPEFAGLSVGKPPEEYVGGREPSETEADIAFQQMFFGPLASRFIRGVMAEAGAWGADLIVSESLEFGGYVAAELLGLPHAVVDTSPLMPLRHPLIPQWIDDLRVRAGLPRADATTAHGARLRAGLLPPAWYPPQVREPSHRYYRPDDCQAAEPLDPAIAHLPADLPTVLVTMGSGAPAHLLAKTAVFETLVAALGSLPYNAVVALGQQTYPSRWNGPRPGNVHLATFVPQRTLLPACAAFITHCGFSGVREAVLAGVPIVALPLFAEHPQNSARVVELGLGVRLDVSALDLESAALAVKRVLEEPSFRHAAKGMQRASLILPGYSQLAADLAELASTRS
jgi:UDP:flavonoid glycosyltransferase YjiC (YdhE family)